MSDKHFSSMSKRLNLVGEEEKKDIRNFSNEKLVCFDFSS